MNIKTFITYSILVSGIISGIAFSQEPSSSRSAYTGVTNPIISTSGAKGEPLPLQGVVAVEKNNVVSFVSENARFQFTGDVIDKWSGKTLQTLSDVSRAFNYADFSDIKFQFDLLNPFVIGSGSKVVTMFVDPLCPHCERIFDELPRDSKQYTFKLIPIGILGKESIQAVKLLECAVDKNSALQALLSKNYDYLKQVKSGCKSDLVTTRLISSRLLGLNGVPYIIRHDGLIAKGYPPMGFMNWIEG